MFDNPEYRILIRKFVGPNEYGPGDLLLEVTDWYNIGWANYVNDVPEAYFTILQKEGDRAYDLLRQYEGKAHVEIRRNGDLVWRGWLMESDATDRDVVFYCYGYLAGLYWSATGWASTFTNARIGDMMEVTWDGTVAKEINGNSVSMLNWVGKGVMQDPVTTTGGSTPIVLPTYKSHHKRVLFMMRELAAIAMSDTQNTVVFEITADEAPEFRIYKDRSVDRPNIVYEWGDDQMAGFRVLRAPVHRRTRLYGVGSNPQNLALRYTWTEGDVMLANHGLREEAMYLAWVRDQEELNRVVKLRAQRARRIDNDVMVRFYPNSVQPPHYYDPVVKGGFNLADRVQVKIDEGITYMNTWMHALGAQVSVGRGGVERVSLILQELVGV
jgi:hypothetical protein